MEYHTHVKFHNQVLTGSDIYDEVALLACLLVMCAVFEVKNSFICSTTRKMDATKASTCAFYAKQKIFYLTLTFNQPLDVFLHTTELILFK